MIVLVPTLLGPAAADPMTLFQGMLGGKNSFRAEVRSGRVSGTIVVRGDGSLIATSGGHRIVHSAAGDGEFDSESKTYDLLPRIGTLAAGEIGTGRLADDARAILPPPLARRQAFAQVRFARKDGGYEARFRDGLHVAKFNAAKRLVSYEIRGDEGSVRWEIVSLTTVPTPADAAFAIRPLPGWTEALEPYIPDLLQEGDPLPPQFASRAPVAEKPWLLAVLDEEPLSRSAGGWLDRFQKVPVVRISAAAATGLKVSRVPMYILVGGDKKVIGIWLGYAKEMEPSLEREIAEAALAGKKP